MQAQNPDQRAVAVEAAFQLLDRVSRIPGSDSDGNVDIVSLRRRLTEVRRLCAEDGRAKVGDHRIGQLRSRAPPDESGLWPCHSIYEVMETVASEDLADGFCIGVYNARGVHSGGEGGDQEREPAARYRG